MVSLSHTKGMSQAEKFREHCLRKLFVATRAELRGDYRKSHNDELTDLCSSSNTDRVVKSRKKEMGGTSGTWGGGGGEVKRPLGRPRHRWTDIK